MPTALPWLNAAGAELGTRAELLARAGVYASLWLVQTGGTLIARSA